MATANHRLDKDTLDEDEAAYNNLLQIADFHPANPQYVLDKGRAAGDGLRHPALRRSRGGQSLRRGARCRSRRRAGVSRLHRRRANASRSAVRPRQRSIAVVGHQEEIRTQEVHGPQAEGLTPARARRMGMRRLRNSPSPQHRGVEFAHISRRPTAEAGWYCPSGLRRLGRDAGLGRASGRAGQITGRDHQGADTADRSHRQRSRGFEAELSRINTALAHCGIVGITDEFHST